MFWLIVLLPIVLVIGVCVYILLKVGEWASKITEHIPFGH